MITFNTLVIESSSTLGRCGMIVHHDLDRPYTLVRSALTDRSIAEQLRTAHTKLSGIVAAIENAERQLDEAKVQRLMPECIVPSPEEMPPADMPFWAAVARYISS